MPGPTQAWHSRVMRGVRVATAAAVATTLLVIGFAAPAGAVSISAPASKNLGSAPTGTASISAQLGTVTAGDTGIAGSFVASVSATVFTTGAGTANETIGKASILYWSGPATASSGVIGGGSPGQLTALQAQDLTVSRTAFSAVGALSISVSWNPTIIVNIPASAVAGTYTGTITHSVA